MRTEKDSMGEMLVPDAALYGASTQRAVLNFEISSLKLSRDFVSALGAIKCAAAQANRNLGLLPARIAEPISRAAREVMDNALDDHFVVDLFQTGSGTSTNMNANEVIANRALELMGGVRGDRTTVHPNDHVNLCQSSNDVIPSAISVASASMLTRKLLPALAALHACLRGKENEFRGIIKAGRTHLQDATPITLGQEFSGYAAQVESGMGRLHIALDELSSLALGGTAVGTGIAMHPDFPRRAIEELNALTGLKFREARNHFEAQATQDASIAASGALRTVAVSLLKIANDIRWLSAGPRCNLAELKLPAIQPGSSIMPAKVNPVICEAVMQVAAKVIGNDATVVVAAQHGNFELNTMLPVIAHCLLESIELLASVAANFKSKCLEGITADSERCMEYAEKSLATCTALAPIVGYDRAAEIAKRALEEDKTVRQVVSEEGLDNDERVKSALNLHAMTIRGGEVTS